MVLPADLFGPNYLKSVRAPLPHLRLMPTGGVSLTNGGEWLDAGAFAVGAGSALVPSAALEARRFDEIRKNALLFTESLKNHLYPFINYEENCHIWRNYAPSLNPGFSTFYTSRPV